MDLALRPRSATEIVDAAVRLFRQHFAAFLTLAAVAAVPRLVLTLTQLGTMRGQFADVAAGRAVATGPFAMFTGPYLLISLVGLLLIALFEGAFISAADDGLRTGTATAGRALSRGMARAVPVVLTFVLVTVLSFGVVALLAVGLVAAGAVTAAGGAGAVPSVGLAVLAVPVAFAVAVYLGIRLYPAVPAAVIEGVGPGEALSRAWRRTAGSVGRGFVVYLILFVIIFLLSMGATLVGGLLGGLVGAVGGVTGAAVGALAVVAVVQVLVSMLYYPLLAAATTLFYYDTRVRSEGLDVELMADALGGPASGAGPGAGYGAGYGSGY